MRKVIKVLHRFLTPHWRYTHRELLFAHSHNHVNSFRCLQLSAHTLQPTSISIQLVERFTISLLTIGESIDHHTQPPSAYFSNRCIVCIERIIVLPRYQEKWIRPLGASVCVFSASLHVGYVHQTKIGLCTMNPDAVADEPQQKRCKIAIQYRPSHVGAW